MQHLVFLTVGRVKSRHIQEGIDQFLRRLNPVMHLEHVVIPPSKQLNVDKYREEESQKLLERARKWNGDLWLLDERGREVTSVQFAKQLQSAKDAGRTLVFILGGAYGVTDAFRKEVKNHLALSQMTFPHELCQLIFLEQLYRATEIQKGSGYHHY